MTKTYWEQRQAAYFKAAREMYRLAASVLDDVQNEAEFTGQTAEWAKSVSADTARKGHALETLGWEEGGWNATADYHLRKAKNVHSRAITAFQKRAEAFGVTV